jgi:hypothetical protein
MKNIFKLCLSTFIVIIVASCDSGFDELNTSKTGALALDPALVLNAASVNSSPGGVGTNPGSPTSSLVYDMAIVQQMISSNSGVLLGGNFNQVNIGSTPNTWVNYFQNVIKYTNDVITHTQSDPVRTNLYNMARIIQANAFMVLTDTYGNIPYSEAGSGYTGDILFPKYETQESIYPKIIQELTDATAALDPAKKIEASDVLFYGDIAKWKKFGYSLLLRAGMRLSKVDPAKAESTVATAFAGGVILSNADNVVIKHDANFQNGIGNVVNGTEAANIYLAEPFVNALKSSDDPRLSAIAVRYVGAASGPDQVAAVATTDPSNQYGMPMGSDDFAAQTAAINAGLVSRYAFSQVDRNRMLKRTSPMFIVTAAQTNLLLAESAVRGWVPGGNTEAANYFTAGIKAHMDQMALYDPASTVDAADRDAYADANPLDVSTLDASLEQINYQYWIASFLHGHEAWANFRRSGYPVLSVNPYPGKTVNFITRITYPPSEILVNSGNVQEAIAQMGSDNLDTHVWWDKQ